MWYLPVVIGYLLLAGWLLLADLVRPTLPTLAKVSAVIDGRSPAEVTSDDVARAEAWRAAGPDGVA